MNSVHFGSVSVVSGPFGSVSGLFRVRFGVLGEVLGGVGVGSGRGASVREKNITRFFFIFNFFVDNDLE